MSTLEIWLRQLELTAFWESMVGWMILFFFTNLKLLNIWVIVFFWQLKAINNWFSKGFWMLFGEEKSILGVGTGIVASIGSSPYQKVFVIQIVYIWPKKEWKKGALGTFLKYILPRLLTWTGNFINLLGDMVLTKKYFCNYC